MSPAQHQELLELYVTARNAWARAEQYALRWPAAFEADKQFTEALQRLVNP